MLEEEDFKKAQEGHFKSIEEICAGTWKTLYRFVYYRVQNREEAEDITQETYVKAISYFRGDLHGADHIMNYLKAVSLNVLRDRWRKSKRQGNRVSFVEAGPEIKSEEDLSERSAQRELIENSLSRLSKDQRTVIELRIVKGYSAAETAKIMDKKEGAVRVLQYRAIKTLNEILKNSDE